MSSAWNALPPESHSWFLLFTQLKQQLLISPFLTISLNDLPHKTCLCLRIYFYVTNRPKISCLKTTLYYCGFPGLSWVSSCIWWGAAKSRNVQDGLLFGRASLHVASLTLEFGLSFFTAWQLDSKREMVLLRPGWKISECHFCCILLVRVSHKPCPDSRGKRIDPLLLLRSNMYVLGCEELLATIFLINPEEFLSRCFPHNIWYYIACLCLFYYHFLPLQLVAMYKLPYCSQVFNDHQGECCIV